MRSTLTALTLAAVLLGAAGCQRDPAKQPDAKAAKKGGHAHEHPDEGPHHGALAEWGEEKYHAEFTVDHKEKKATVYILGGDAKKPAPIKAETITLSITNVKPPVQIALKAEPQEGDPKGESSRFVGTHDQLGTKMEFEGEISGKVGDTPYAGKFKEEAHDDEPKKK